MALVLAGLVAEGETVVSGAHHIGRGYEDLAGALRSLGAKVTLPVSPLPSDPAALLDRARAGDRVALARLLSYVERGGETAMAVARLAYRADVPYTVGLTGAPGAGKSTLTDGLITAVRGGWPDGAAIGPGRRPGGRPDVALQRGRHPGRPRAHEPARARPDGVHPLDGDQGPPRRPLARRPRRRPPARRGRHWPW